MDTGARTGTITTGRMTTRTRTSRTGMDDGSGRVLAVNGALRPDALPAAIPQPGRQAREARLDGAALWKLATWLSPGYPVGAFAYSHGLEWAVASGAVTDASSVGAWIADCVEHGAGRADAILLAHAWRAGVARDKAEIAALVSLAAALAPSAERLLETRAQGAAFAATTGAVWEDDGVGAPYPVAVGRAAGRHGVPLEPTALLYLHAFAANLVSASVRLVPLGQTDGQRVLAVLLPLCRRTAEEAISATPDDIGGCAFRADIAAMRHETQEPRLFRT
jgi:urease accessory protein